MNLDNLTVKPKQKLMLALKACCYATITNTKCVGATYL